MRKVLDERLRRIDMKDNPRSLGLRGAFTVRRQSPVPSDILRIISSGPATVFGLARWEHVSVSLENRCPTWDEMCFVKDLFWEPEECVIQYHPPRSKYVNNHPYVLHMWKPPRKIAMPPIELV